MFWSPHYAYSSGIYFYSKSNFLEFLISRNENWKMHTHVSFWIKIMHVDFISNMNEIWGNKSYFLQFYLLRTSSFWGLRPQTHALYFRESNLNQFRVKYRRILWTKKSASIVILFVILFLGAAPPRSLLFISGNQILTNFVSNTDEIYKQINRIPL